MEILLKIDDLKTIKNLCAVSRRIRELCQLEAVKNHIGQLSNDLIDIVKYKGSGWKERLEDLLGRGLTYRGKDLLEVYLKAFDKKFPKHERRGAQEVYLGYNMKNDTFISGWDWWPELEDEEDETDMGTNMGTLLFKFTLDNAGNANILSREEELWELYEEGGVYEQLKKNPDIVDLRLD